MSFENNSINLASGSARNFYGPRSAKEGIEGSIKTEGSVQELTIKFTGANVNDDVFSANLAILPAGAKVIAAYVRVESAFTTTGTTPKINIGEDGDEATNGVSIAESGAGTIAVGTYDDGDTEITINGDWATGVTADTQVSLALSGTTPTVAGGYAIATLKYIKLA